VAPLLRARALFPEGTGARLFLVRAYAETGRLEESRAILDAMVIDARNPRADLGHIERAAILDAAGFRDEAFAELDRSFTVREGGIRFVLLDPAFRGMHGDPRLAALTRRLKLTS
jgi:hypothetical protein